MRKLTFLVLITSLFLIGSCKPVSFSEVSSGLTIVKSGFEKIIHNSGNTEALTSEEDALSETEDFFSFHLSGVWNLRMMIK